MEITLKTEIIKKGKGLNIDYLREEAEEEIKELLCI